MAREGETKITETVRITALGKEVEEYMHGPYIGLHASDHVIFIEPNGKLQERVAKLQKFLTGKVAKVVRITNGQVDRQDDLGLALPTDELLAPLFMTIPIHLLAYTASARKQINLKVAAFPDFDPITNSKI
ncbi:SIS domain-containing protein [Latilactobacillus curvatus]|uniref:SIS domain-containing protein n=1 Tax=Latilactobacillus curvatus TaxID=28038 RepID=UPI003C2FEE01